MAQELRNKHNFDQSWKSDATKINWLVDSNPKRAGFKAHARFEKYFGAQTSGEYYELGGSKGDLQYDWEHNFLDLEPTTKEEDAELVIKTDEQDETDAANDVIAELEALIEAEEAKTDDKEAETDDKEAETDAENDEDDELKALIAAEAAETDDKEAETVTEDDEEAILS